MAGLKLYELTEQYRQVGALLETAAEAAANGDEGAAEMEQVWKDTLEGITGSVDQKLLNIARLVREKQAEADAIKAEKQRIEKRQKAAERSADWLRGYMSFAMDQTGLSKAKDEVISISYGAGRPKVSVTNMDALLGRADVWKPYKYDEANLDKTGLKERLEAGEQIDGLELVAEKVLTIR